MNFDDQHLDLGRRHRVRRTARGYAGPRGINAAIGVYNFVSAAFIQCPELVYSCSVEYWPLLLVAVYALSVRLKYPNQYSNHGNGLNINKKLTCGRHGLMKSIIIYICAELRCKDLHDTQHYITYLLYVPT